VLAVMAGLVFSARQVRKVHPYRVDAFDGGDSGPQGWVEEGRVRWAGAVDGAACRRRRFRRWARCARLPNGLRWKSW
jgi:L-asparaginase/Glu-tRNA(Gln) amidotransferase subunit D